ncbi:hypothetical protein NC652_004070 [Populus alba x Populus x berolinensis]|nr:hypothetical protein NC652_004070 [Populus alba x Populus x berolinensis]
MESYHHFGDGDAHLPPGFRFHPTDEELITYYLLKKVLDRNFTGRAIAEVDLNKCEPWELPGKAKMVEKEWYFFSLRDRKYPTGLRTNRATEAGYWKATGKDREIHSSKTGALVGMKKTLVFYRGRAPEGGKSNWVMHEYRLEGKFAYHYLSGCSKDEWVISRVFQKSCGGAAASSGNITKKNRFDTTINLYTEANSPSSVSLPPLLDATTTITTTTLNDRDSCSYDNHTQHEHVSCFSTIAAAAYAAANNNTNFDIAQLPPPPMTDPFSTFPGNTGVNCFPNLTISVTENVLDYHRRPSSEGFHGMPCLTGHRLNKDTSHVPFNINLALSISFSSSSSSLSELQLSLQAKQKKTSVMDGEEFSMEDPSQLLQSASDFANYPGVPNDVAAKEFLDRFPLPVIINALQTKSEVPGLEATLAACLERIFKTKYGASLIPLYMPFVQVGLTADSQLVRCLACKTVSCLLENIDETISAAQLIIDNGVYPLLLDCLINGNEQVATASIEAIEKLAGSKKGMEIVFPANNSDDMHLGNLSARCSSLGRVRVLSLIVKLFSVSRDVASAVYNSNLLSLLEEKIRNTDDTLVSLSVFELFYELAEVKHATEFLSKTTLVQLLSSTISNMSKEAILRSRAMMISGRLLSNDNNIYKFIDESNLGVKTIISAIDGRLLLEIEDLNECESALEALGQIGSSSQGATLLLTFSPPAARHVIDAAFDKHARGKQLASLHSLANISGETRSDSNIILNGGAEASLRLLIYDAAASKSSKLTPSGLFLSVLQQDSEVRLAAYRVLTGLVARPWCLMEICSKQEIINIVTGPKTETTKIGMEARYKCCVAIHRAFMSSSKLTGNPALAPIAAKLQEAVSRGPYLADKIYREAQPMREEIFPKIIRRETEARTGDI